MARAAVRTAEANAGAYDDSSNGDGATASAVRCSYAASGTANNPKATAAATKHTRTARAAVRTAEAHGVGNGARNETTGNNEAKASAARRLYVEAGAYNEGSNGDEAAASAARRAYAASGTADDQRATATAARRARMARAAVRMTKANAGAYHEGSEGDKAMARSAKRSYAASSIADDPKATAAAARRARTARAAICTAEAHGIGNGARNEGSGNDEAEVSAARRTYIPSATSDAGKAAAFAARCASAALASGRTAKGGGIHNRAVDEGPNKDEAGASALCTYASSNEDEASTPAARRGCVANAAQRTAGGDDFVDGTLDEGSNVDKADVSAARCKHRLRRQ